MVAVSTYVGRQFIPQRGASAGGCAAVEMFVEVRTGEAVRQGTLVCLRRVPCVQGRVSYTQSVT